MERIGGRDGLTRDFGRSRHENLSRAISWLTFFAGGAANARWIQSDWTAPRRVYENLADAKLRVFITAMGKDERAISVSGYVHRGLVKYTDYAFHKTAIYKQHVRNHLLDQIESFRVGDRNSDREDDLLDTFCYGIALALGNSEGF
jgi:hypothetical protein